MNRLVLIRHAKSDWKNAALRDFDRPLNKRGLRDAPRMAEELKKRGIIPDHILTSPANRAVSTARLMADVFDYPGERIEEIPAFYLADTGDLAHGVEGLSDSVGTAFLFGHNPGISLLASCLTGVEISMPTCTAVVLDMTHGWKHPAAEEYLIYRPKDFH